MRPGQPSRTALVVAGGVVFAADEPSLRGCVDPNAAQWTRDTLKSWAGGRRLLHWIDSRLGRKAIRLAERCTIPGIIGHWVCRKQWLAAAWRTAESAGFDTLVVLGSGFDSLSPRVAQASAGGILTVDVDHPATLAVRLAAIEKRVSEAHRFVSHDLSMPGLWAALQGVIPEAASTVVIIEGVLMYLQPERVSELFRELARLRLRQLRVAFTFMETAAGAPPAFRPRSRLIDAWLRLRREPFQSGLDPDTLGVWLQQRGYRLIEQSVAPGREPVLGNELRGECGAIADRDATGHNGVDGHV